MKNKTKGYMTESDTMDEIKENNYLHKSCFYFVNGDCCYFKKEVVADHMACYMFMEKGKKING